MGITQEDARARKKRISIVHIHYIQKLQLRADHGLELDPRHSSRLGQAEQALDACADVLLHTYFVRALALGLLLQLGHGVRATRRGGCRARVAKRAGSGIAGDFAMFIAICTWGGRGVVEAIDLTP